MSKSITVPTTIENDPLTITIAGVSYSLAPGATLTVPDEVAYELARMLGSTHLPAPGVVPPFDLLPIVDADNDGDVLTVVEGKWAAAPSSGGGLKVTITEEDDVFTMDKTAKEIWDTLQSGVMPLFLYDDSPEGMSEYRVSETPSSFSFSSEDGYSFVIDMLSFDAASDDDYPSYDGGGK